MHVVDLGKPRMVRAHVGKRWTRVGNASVRIPLENAHIQEIVVIMKIVIDSKMVLCSVIDRRLADRGQTFGHQVCRKVWRRVRTAEPRIGFNISHGHKITGGNGSRHSPLKELRGDRVWIILADVISELRCLHVLLQCHSLLRSEKEYRAKEERTILENRTSYSASKIVASEFWNVGLKHSSGI